MTDLVVGNGMPSSHELDTMERMSNTLAGSGLFKDAKTARAAFAKVLYGRDMGLSASAAMTGLHIVEGKPELSANLQAQLVNTYTGPDGERYRFRVREHNTTKCAIEYQIKEGPGAEWESLGTSTYTMDDAKAAGLSGKGVWKKHPRNMLWARAMSDGVNFYCPEVARGLRVYHEGEISEAVNAAPVPVQAPVAEPEIVEVVELVSDEQAQTILQGIGLLPEGVKVATVLVAHGASVDRDSLEATVRSLPAGAVDDVCQWLSDQLDAVPEGGTQ